MDREYIDFSRLYKIKLASGFFITRAKKNSKFKRVYSNSKNNCKEIKHDQLGKLTGHDTNKSYPDLIRSIKFYDKETDKTFVFLTNNFEIPAVIIAALYKNRWKVELFFKWIKQHLKIKTFFGTTENAVFTQIWIAISVYVLVAIVKKILNLKQSMYTILQILSFTLFEKMPINQLFLNNDYKDLNSNSCKQLNLFDF